MLRTAHQLSQHEQGKQRWSSRDHTGKGQSRSDGYQGSTGEIQSRNCVFGRQAAITRRSKLRNSPTDHRSPASQVQSHSSKPQPPGESRKIAKGSEFASYTFSCVFELLQRSTVSAVPWDCTTYIKCVGSGSCRRSR